MPTWTLERVEMLTNTIRYALIIGIIIFFIMILKYLKDKTLNLKYSLLWLFTGVCLLILAIFPKLLDMISALIGIYSPVNALFMLGFVFVIMILMSLTSIVSRQNRKIRTLIQELAILEKRVREVESQTDGKENE